MNFGKKSSKYFALIASLFLLLLLSACKGNPGTGKELPSDTEEEIESETTETVPGTDDAEEVPETTAPLQQVKEKMDAALNAGFDFNFREDALENYFSAGIYAREGSLIQLYYQNDETQIVLQKGIDEDEVMEIAKGYVEGLQKEKREFQNYDVKYYFDAEGYRNALVKSDGYYYAVTAVEAPIPGEEMNRLLAVILNIKVVEENG